MEERLSLLVLFLAAVFIQYTRSVCVSDVVVVAAASGRGIAARGSWAQWRYFWILARWFAVFPTKVPAFVNSTTRTPVFGINCDHYSEQTE